MTRHSGWVLLAALLLGSAAQALEVETARIAHGVRAWYAPSDLVPVVDIQISFEGAGYASDPSGHSGRAALTAAMLTEGAGDYDALAFSEALEDGAIRLSASSSADRFTIHLHALRDQAEQAGKLLAIALRDPQFAPQDMARVKAEMTSMLTRLEESASYRSGRLLTRTAFAGHPYANAPYGTADTLDQLTAEDLRRFMRTYLTRHNVLIVAAGDVDAGLLDRVLEPVVEALSDNAVEPYVTPVTVQQQGTQVDDRMGVPQTVVSFAAPGIARDDARFYAASILNHALGGNGLIARLARGIRQDRGLVYSIGTDLDVKRGAAMITGKFATRNSQAGDAMAAVKAVLENVQKKGLTAEECEDARRYVINAAMLELDSSTAVARMLLAMRIHDLGEDYLDKREEYLTAVRCEDVNTLAAELLAPERFLFATVGGTADVAP